MQTIAEKEDGANGHRSAFRSVQTVKILPMRTSGDARSAIYAVLTCSRAARRPWSLSTATTVQPRAAKATALRPYPQEASSTVPLPKDATWSANLRRVFEGLIGRCAVFITRKRPEYGRCSEFL